MTVLQVVYYSLFIKIIVMGNMKLFYSSLARDLLL